MYVYQQSSTDMYVMTADSVPATTSVCVCGSLKQLMIICY